jgi:4-methyl-5(b-hydroxyethyl)-thiazole monophosphate biosynthesis
MSKILLPLAPGFEELEAVTLIDLLRRAGFDVVVAGVSDGAVRGSRGTTIVPDMTLDQALHRTFDMLVLPGGEPGATHLECDERILDLIRKMNAAENRLAAVCAAPRVLATAGVLDHKRATCYTGAIDADRFPYVRLEQAAVVTDGNVTTSRGPGTAMDFALELIELLAGKTKRVEVEAKLLRA